MIQATILSHPETTASLFGLGQKGPLAVVPARNIVGSANI